MPVYSNDGEKLGKVTNLGNDYFIVEKGFFFPKDFTLRYEDIQNVRDGSVYLAISKAELSDWREPSYAGWQQTEEINAGRLNAEPLDEYRDRYARFSSEETKVPIVEEELQVEKTSKQKGEIKIRKVVHTELRHFTIPVMKEEVRIDRVPVTERESSAIGADTGFQENTIRIPIVEEEISISKRPVVKEEVRVSKERTIKEEEVQGEVRKEEVEIEGEDLLKRKKAG